MSSKRFLIPDNITMDPQGYVAFLEEQGVEFKPLESNVIHYSLTTHGGNTYVRAFVIVDDERRMFIVGPQEDDEELLIKAKMPLIKSERKEKAH